jgi:hypothetical protein
MLGCILLNVFTDWFAEGVKHIINWQALDHMLFVVALCLPFYVKDWKKIVGLITAFTVGHSITLALTALQVISVNVKWIEFFIPITIAITCINNIKRAYGKQAGFSWVNYFLAAVFGCIHGVAFAKDFTSIFTPKEILPILLSFNIGIEAAQIIVILLVMMICYIVVHLRLISLKWWTVVGSSAILAYVMYLAYLNYPL